MKASVRLGRGCRWRARAHRGELLVALVAQRGAPRGRAAGGLGEQAARAARVVLKSLAIDLAKRVISPSV